MSHSHTDSNQRSPNTLLRQTSGHNPATGFSLVELMVAMAVFLVVGGAAIGLVKSHMPLFNSSQNQTTLNITLRNAVAQMQMEVVNAGTGFSTGANTVSFSPMGATIQKAANANCKATATYGPTCFDQLKLISVDGNIPALAPSADAAATKTIDVTKAGSTTIFLTVPGNAAGTGIPAAQYTTWASNLKQGSELMLVQGGTDVSAATGQPNISIIVLSADAVVNGTSIQLTTNAPNGPNGAFTCANAPSADRLNIYDDGECARFTATFNPQLDYVVKLVAGATYSVDASNPANPKLIRTDATGTQDTIAEQIIGFTVGAWSSQRVVGGVITPGYTTNPLDYNKDWASVRSLQVQLVARATPNSDTSIAFQNAYDGGNYQVQGMQVVINPRNLNLN